MSQEPDAARVPGMIRSSVVTHRRRCGKPTCRCATGEALHECAHHPDIRSSSNASLIARASAAS